MKPANTVRIIGGKWRGKKISFPENSPARPTLDHVRETLFNWLQPVIVGSRCLDAFAGSGALGIEALSRGAAHVTFVDQDISTTAYLKKQLQTLDAHHAECFSLSLPAGLSQIISPPFDIIFLDPPFNTSLLDQTLQSLTTSVLVKPGTLVYFEADVDHKFNFENAWKLYRHKKTKRIAYGLLEFM